MKNVESHSNGIRRICCRKHCTRFDLRAFLTTYFPSVFNGIYFRLSRFQSRFIFLITLVFSSLETTINNVVNLSDDPVLTFDQ